MDPRLEIAGDREPVFEADDRALIEGEQIGRELAEVCRAADRARTGA